MFRNGNCQIWLLNTSNIKIFQQINVQHQAHHQCAANTTNQKLHITNKNIAKEPKLKMVDKQNIFKNVYFSPAHQQISVYEAEHLAPLFRVYEQA